MQAILLNLIYVLLRYYAGSEAFERVRSLVVELIDSDIPGSEKRDYVLNWAKNELSEIKSYVISAVIEIVLLKTSDAVK